MKKFKNIIFWLVTVLLTVISFGNQMSFVLPMALITYALREKLKNFLNRFPLPAAFLGSGLFFGLLTELFAIWNNLKFPLGERALLSPYPIVDLVLSFFWYGLFVLVWYFLLKRYRYSKKELFVFCGIYGLIFEQQATYFFMLFTSQILLSLFIMFVYAVFPMLAYMLTEHRFTAEQKQAPFYFRYLLACIGLALHAGIWKVFGLLYYPLLKKLGYLSYLEVIPK